MPGVRKAAEIAAPPFWTVCMYNARFRRRRVLPAPRSAVTVLSDG